MNIRVHTLIFATCVGLAGCDRAPAVRFATVSHDWFNAPVTIAQDKFVKDTGVTVNTFDLTSGLASETAVLSGNADIGLASPVPILRDPSAMSKIYVLGCYMRSSQVLGFAHHGSEPITAAPIAYVPGTISEVFLRKYLAKQGLSVTSKPATVTLLPIRPPLGVEDFKKNAVGSFAIWEPYISDAVADVADGQKVFDPSLYQVNVCLITSHAAYTANRTNIDKVAGAVANASGWIGTNPVDARHEVEKALDYPADKLQPVWDKVDFHYESDATKLKTVFSDEADALVQTGMLTSKPDITLLF